MWTWAAAGLAVLGGLGYACTVLPTQWLKVERVNWQLGLQRTILQVSDLHVERNRVSPQRLAALCRSERPDYICLTGDYVDSERAIARLLPFLCALQTAGVPMYAVLGNHDYKLRNRIGALIDCLQAHGVVVLRNESVVLDGFNLVGIDDYQTRNSDERAAYRRVKKDLPVIVMTHDPTFVLTAKRRFDALMAGHLHGKQFQLPFFYYLKPMGPLAKRGIYAGMHRAEAGPYYISKGVGQSGINLRFFVRSEVTVHRF
ncbi:metallophosphoesterase [Alicyclobacillus acidocaldarius]|uniref:Metallophosphoesterase n=1 Tax=Alicyclobacillus acidocaldarius (strain Tc-4-1) TaxID=1048834 RepID=F8IG55_ALIAT|nr:metallophosphoesterase [Alicyclobacillus acidocaldarius]AEJ44208.1 metallophosphoesterase [Alicyclobacillus acidocaldarius subsp. acidocaldarius Tc-4-1]